MRHSKVRIAWKKISTQDNFSESMKLYFNMKIYLNAETRMPKNKSFFTSLAHAQIQIENSISSQTEILHP